jgi:hypothetical protein
MLERHADLGALDLPLEHNCGVPLLTGVRHP